MGSYCSPSFSSFMQLYTNQNMIPIDTAPTTIGQKNKLPAIRIVMKAACSAFIRIPYLAKSEVRF